MYRLTRNGTSHVNVVGTERKNMSRFLKNSQSAFGTYDMQSRDRRSNKSLNVSYDVINRNLNTEGIEGASPKKFKHMSKKLFVDRKEILSVLGGKPGRYHGYQNDKPVGGTYKESEDPFWKEKGKLDKKIIAGVRLPSKDFQAKRKTGHIESNNVFNMPTTVASNKLSDYISKSPEPQTSKLQQRVIRDLGKIKENNNKLPVLRESASIPIIDPFQGTPYKKGVENAKMNNSVSNQNINPKYNQRGNYSNDYPYNDIKQSPIQRLRRNNAFSIA